MPGATVTTFCLLATTCSAAQAAVLSYTSALRFLQKADAIIEPPASFAPMDIAVTGARQQSILLPDFVRVLSSVNGSAERGLSVMKVTFQLTESTTWSARVP